MRVLRSLVVVMSLCLCLGPSVVSAAEVPKEPVGREAGSRMASFLDHLGAFLKAIWETEGCEIDPWGRCVPGTGAPDPGTPGTDWAGDIDPLG
jgi:hypothetical protein